MPRRRLRGVAGVITALFVCAILAAPAAAQVKTKTSAPPAKSEAAARVDNQTSRLNAEVIRTTTEYRDQLALQKKLEDLEVDRRAREVERRTDFRAKGYISQAELEEAKVALAKAQAKLGDTEQRIQDAEMVLGEAQARALPSLPAGGYSESATLVRYNGTASWSLADSGKVEQFFAARFGHPLPVSARGETELHRRMRFDHKNAIDVAVHPDSAEGRALMDYLRKAGIPFIAFRGKMAGSSTGAHIHIGKPSLRLAGQ
ncbi:MAG TPA: hypothetical protein VGL11_07350 [Candidatus Binatia bacterium]